MSSLSDLAEFLTGTVTVQPYAGRTGNGVDQYGPPVTVPCSLERRSRFVRNLDGDQITSTTTVTADLTWTSTLTARSKVTLDGRTTTVISVAVDEADALFDGIEAVTAYLQ